jgi:hypothetical protein
MANENVLMTGEIGDEDFKKWKNEYGHPLLVGKKREASQIKRIVNIRNDSEIDNIAPS